MSELSSNQHRFVRSRSASLRRDDLNVVWAEGSSAIAVDDAALMLLEFFAEPLSISELADDLSAALDVDRTQAEVTANNFVLSLAFAGHLTDTDSVQRTERDVAYPPGASL